jgi:hypothetical protein
MRISICILLHPARKQYLEYLISKLGNVMIALDTGTGLNENSKNAWSRYSSDADFHLVLDDDSLICKNFYSELNRILEDDSFAYSLYWGEIPLAPEAYRKGYHEDLTLMFGNSICLPTKIIPQMLEFASQPHLKDMPFDGRIARYLPLRNMPVRTPIPCLVDHRTETKSLVGNNGLNRKAFSFIGE